MNDYPNIHTHNINEKDKFTIVNLFPENAEKIISENADSLFSIGLHPCFINENTANNLLEIEKLSTLPQVFAIGEIGLDKRAETSLEQQTEIFKAQIKIANQVQKPIIIHCVKAFQEILSIKKELNPTIPFIFHGFRGKPELAKQLLKNNCFISVGKNAVHIPETVQTIPLDSLFLETDEKKFSIKDLYNEVALIKRISVEEVSKQIVINFQKLTSSDYNNRFNSPEKCRF